MIIPLIRKGKEEEGIIWVDVNDITHLLRTRREVEFHTLDGIYVLPNALEYWKEPLKQKGFERLDWSVLANMNKIILFNEKEQSIFFKIPSKGIIIAKTHFSKIKNFLLSDKREED